MRRDRREISHAETYERRGDGFHNHYGADVTGHPVIALIQRGLNQPGGQAVAGAAFPDGRREQALPPGGA